jgi:hypothetical protein
MGMESWLPCVEYVYERIVIGIAYALNHAPVFSLKVVPSCAELGCGVAVGFKDDAVKLFGE